MQPITDAMQLFRHQRAVRAWSDRLVTDEDLRTVLQTATHAPSGSNTQPWRFLIIRDPQVKRAVSAQYEAAQATRANAGMAARSAEHGVMAQAPVLIIPCVRIPTRTARAGFQTGASIYPACQNLMLAARALGLGTVLTTTHRIRTEQVHALLGIPPGWDSAAIIPLGWPDRSYGPNHRPPLADVVCYDHWTDPATTLA